MSCLVILQALAANTAGSASLEILRHGGRGRIYLCTTHINWHVGLQGELCWGTAEQAGGNLGLGN